MPLDDVHIHLDAFDGPLDLLLHLIRKNEVEITDIPIAELTGQYLVTLTGIDRIDIELAGEFLVMAATLMEIKSKMLMPRPAMPPGRQQQADPLAALPGEPEDPRADLVRQLLAYKRFRDAAGALDRRLTEWERRFPGGGAFVPTVPRAEDEETAVEIDDLGITDLTRAFAAIMDTVDFARLGDHRVRDDETPIELHAADLLERLRSEASSHGTIEFRAVFAGRSRSEMIGLFLAMLELIRQRKIRAQQDSISGEIVIAAVPEGEIDPAAAPVATQQS